MAFANGAPMKIIEVAAGLVFRGGRLLITQRQAGDHLGGYWEFPGGKREPHEDYPTCLARELREELGVQVEVGRLLAEVDHPYPDRIIHLKFFRCTLLAGEPQTIDCQAVAWVEPPDLQRYTFPPADASLLDQLVASPDLWRD